MRVPREKTAIRRNELSRPVQVALETDLLRSTDTVLDFGCGLGDDVRRLSESGYAAYGWDPVHAPDGIPCPADFVNLGYVVNVIERPEERVAVLREAWGLAKRVLLVSARLKSDAKINEATDYRDGILTSTGTFQRYYSQDELRSWMAAALRTDPTAVCPGSFAVFRAEADRTSYLLARQKIVLRRVTVRQSDRLFEQHRDILQPLIDFYLEHGRIPKAEEVDCASAIVQELGSIRNAFWVIQRATGKDQWEDIAIDRSRDLVTHLAVDRLNGRPRFSALPRVVQHDVRGLFGSYKRACDLADALLEHAGAREIVDATVRSAEFGKLTPSAFYCHADHVGGLHPVLRVMEGLARRYVGLTEGATLVKWNREKPIVSFLYYPDFDAVGHPALERTVIVNLSKPSVDLRHHGTSSNPPILHRKECFLPKDDPRVQRFSRLTRQEERAGLLDDTATIGTQNAWEDRLGAHGLSVHGHQLRRKRI